MKKQKINVFGVVIAIILLFQICPVFAESNSITLKLFSSAKYPEFSCGYPSSFELYDDYDTTLLTVRSKKDHIDLQINVVSQNGATVSSAKDKYIKDILGGKIEYQASGNDYYALRILKNNVYNYVYCKFMNGNIYYFEVQYSDADYGDKIVNAVYNSFSVKKTNSSASKSASSSKSSSSSSSKKQSSSSSSDSVKKQSSSSSSDSIKKQSSSSSSDSIKKQSSSSSSSSSKSNSGGSSSTNSSGGFPLKPEIKEKCNHCDGKGFIECPSCGGSKGKKVRSASVPNYSGKAKSVDLYTEKWEDCFRCHGKGTIDCPYC